NVETDLPRDQLPNLAAVASEMGTKSIFQVVIKIPLIKPATISPYGSVQVPNLARIQAMAAGLFSPPGIRPTVDLTGTAAPGSSTDPGASTDPASAAPAASQGP
ncbi:MAG TPA: hypothetical protein VIB99_11380, partial [Candidatus Limnocylindrales bacterium]